jgi:hypothetical protein
MARKKGISYEARKLSKEKWGLFVVGTDICYGVSTGKSAETNVKLSAKRINNSHEEVVENKEEKK